MERNYISKYADADTKAFVLTKRAEKVTNFCENVRSYRSEHEMYPYKNRFKNLRTGTETKFRPFVDALI